MKQKITSLAVALTFLHSQIAYALPVKNNASNGVQFAKNQNTLNITAPDKSVINYDSFNIAANEAVNFVQPGASASVLNRVLSGGASTINGALAANGNVLLVNPSGVMFGGGATVNANSFIASTKNITDANFQAGLLKFEGSTSGTIVNNGLINGSKNVGLIAANIENKGTIKAGKNAGLIASNTGSVSVDFDGDGLINFTADSSTIGSGTIKNSGTIKAGQVLLTANDVSNVLENVINNTGTIEATKAVTGENGAIQLISDASVKNTGNLKAPEGKIIINTGGDMNSEGTISAVDGEVDIDATGDVTSSGTLEAGKLTEKGATFGISGTFSVDESSLKNDDDAIEFTGDTTLTGNISDVDNIIVGGGVTLTLAADVTLTAGADTNANTSVNDSSNMNSGGGTAGGDFIWMADDAVIEGAGYNLTFDTKGENSWLTSINGVNDLTFLNGNTDKVSSTVTYALKKDITTTGTFTIGEGTRVYLYPIDSAGVAISDIKLTADKFVVGGTVSNPGLIKTNGKNLTLDATSTTENSGITFDAGSLSISSTGSLTLLGNRGPKFTIGALTDSGEYTDIRVNGLTLGDTNGRAAYLDLYESTSIGSTSTTLSTDVGAGADANINITNYSRLILREDTTLIANAIGMAGEGIIACEGNKVTFSTADISTIYAIHDASGITFERMNEPALATNANYRYHYDTEMTGEFIVSENATLSLEGECIHIWSDRFDSDKGKIVGNGYQLVLYGSDSASKIGDISSLSGLSLNKNTGSNYAVYDLTNTPVLNVNSLHIQEDTTLNCYQKNTQINAQNIYAQSGSKLSAFYYDDSSTSVNNNLTLNVSNAASINTVSNIHDFTLLGGGTITFLGGTAYGCPPSGLIDVQGAFIIGDNTDIVMQHQYAGLGSDYFNMSSTSSITAMNHLYMDTMRTTSFINDITVAGDLTLQGGGSAPTTYLKSGTIICSNNNTPTYVNAN